MPDQFSPNAEMIAFTASADFRILLTQDPALRACYNYGKSPLETIIILADRAQLMCKKMEEIHMNGLPPVFIRLPNVRDHREPAKRYNCSEKTQCPVLRCITLLGIF